MNQALERAGPMGMGGERTPRRTTGDGRDECGSRSRDVRATKQNHGIRERS
jgi:hypothetical protein